MLPTVARGIEILIELSEPLVETIANRVIMTIHLLALTSPATADILLAPLLCVLAQ